LFSNSSKQTFEVFRLIAFNRQVGETFYGKRICIEAVYLQPHKSLVAQNARLSIKSFSLEPNNIAQRLIADISKYAETDVCEIFNKT
jgi:hypothetical protein